MYSKPAHRDLVYLYPEKLIVATNAIQDQEMAQTLCLTPVEPMYRPDCFVLAPPPALSHITHASPLPTLSSSIPSHPSLPLPIPSTLGL